MTWRLWSEYLPDKYVACNTQGLCGRRSHCYLHDPGDLEEHKPIARCRTDTAGHVDLQRGATVLYLQNDPLHDPQIVKDRHHTAEEHNDWQSLWKESKPAKRSQLQ